MIVRYRKSPMLERQARDVGDIAGYSAAEAKGRLIDLWAQCLEEKSELLSDRHVRAHLGPRGVEALIEAGLGERMGDWVRVRGAKEEIAQLDRRQEAARKAGQASGRVRAQSGEAIGPESTRTNTERDVQRHVDPTSTLSQLDVNSTSTSKSSSDLGSGISGSLFSEASASSETSGDLKQRGRRKKPAFPMPSDFEPTESHREYASANAIDLAHEFRRFANHHEAKGSVFASWAAALRTWLENAVEYRSQRSPANRTHGSAAAFDLVREAEERERAQRGESK